MKSKPSATRPVVDRVHRAADLSASVEQCRRDAVFLTALQDLYKRVDDEMGRRGALCLGGGGCCKFDLTERCVYLSTGELALLTELPPMALDRCERGRCGYQSGPRCTARARRPLGCRIFFCGRALTNFIHESYEAHHKQITLLHQMRCLPYAYTELTRSVLQLFSSS